MPAITWRSGRPCARARPSRRVSARRRKKSLPSSSPPASCQQKLDSWAEHLYGNRAHAGIAGKAPNQAAAEWAGEVRHIANERALAIIAEEAVARRIGRDGIRIAGARFVPTTPGGAQRNRAGESASGVQNDDSINNYVAHVGETALCFPDPSGDLGRYLLFLETPRGREFIATVENSERCGRDRGELALLARQAQDQFIRTGRAGLRRLRKRIKPETLADAILDHASSHALTADVSPVQHLSLSRPALEERSDEGERSAQMARSANDAPGEGMVDQSDEPVASVLEGIPHPGDAIAADWQRYRALRSSACLTVENRAWMAHYETTREYRVARAFESDPAPERIPQRSNSHE